MIERFISILLLVIAIIHFLPITGLLGITQLDLLYEIEIAGPNQEILLRHRAVLFGILGLHFTYAAFRPDFQPFAFVLAFISIVSFLGLAFSVGGYNGAIRRVVIADVIALICLVLAIGLYIAAQRAAN